MKAGSIAKIKIPSFHASVIEAKDSSLKKRPFVVSWPGAQRAVVLESSFNAQMEGIRRGMNLKKALRMVPGLIVVPPCAELQAKADRLILEICRRYSPVIEFKGQGQAFIDLGGTEKLWGKALDTVSRISGDIRDSFPSPLSVGTGSGKTVSHIAAALARPSGIIAVNHGSEKDFIFPQPVFLLPGIRRSIVERLNILGIESIGGLAQLSSSDSIKLLGKDGDRIRSKALGENETLKTENSAELKIRSSIVNPQDCELLERAAATLMKACEKAGLKLRTAGLSAHRITVTVLYSDGLVRTKTKKTVKPQRTDLEIFHIALPLLKQIHAEKRTRIRTVSLTLYDLDEAHLQTNLFERNEMSDPLQDAVDTIRKRYGGSAIINALTMT